MTQQQLEQIMKSYNQSVERMQEAAARLDTAKGVYADRLQNSHTFELGTQNGIFSVLYTLGYTIETDDEDFAVSIDKKEEQNA